MRADISSLLETSITQRIDGVTHLRPEYQHAKIPAPPSVKIELTGQCNLRCSFCALVTRETQPTKPMDFELFKKIVTEMQAAGVREVGLFLIGESFLCMDMLVKACQFAHDLGMFTFLTTNGTLATPERVKLVMDAGLNSLKFSLTTADDEQYKKVLGRPASLRHRAVANIKAARKVRDDGGYKCKLSASWIDFKDDQRAKMQEAVNEVGDYLDEVYALPLYSFGSLAESGQRGAGLDAPTAGNIGRVGGHVPPLPCWLPFQEAHVLHDGRLTLCSFDAGREDHNWVVGDLNTESFMDAWNCEAAQSLRRAHLKRDVRGTVCEKCAAYGS